LEKVLRQFPIGGETHQVSEQAALIAKNQLVEDAWVVGLQTLSNLYALVTNVTMRMGARLAFV
jgi:hypothetical protein